MLRPQPKRPYIAHARRLDAKRRTPGGGFKRLDGFTNGCWMALERFLCPTAESPSRALRRSPVQAGGNGAGSGDSQLSIQVRGRQPTHSEQRDVDRQHSFPRRSVVGHPCPQTGGQPDHASAAVHLELPQPCMFGKTAHEHTAFLENECNGPLHNSRLTSWVRHRSQTTSWTGRLEAPRLSRLSCLASPSHTMA